MKPNRRQIALAMLAGALVLLAACTTPAETPLPADRTDHKFSVATDATNQFGLALFRQVAANASGGNVLLSPFSIQSALAMTYAGADGDTRAEMARVLHFPEDDAPLADSFGALRGAFDEAVKKSNDVQAVVINSYKNVAGIAAQQIQDLKMQYPGMPPQYLAEMQQQIEQSARENAKIAETIKPHLTELHVANRLFGQKDFEFRQPFLDLTRDRYGAQLQPLDFKTAAEVCA